MIFFLLFWLLFLDVDVEAVVAMDANAVDADTVDADAVDAGTVDVDAVGPEDGVGPVDAVDVDGRHGRGYGRRGRHGRGPRRLDLT